MKKMLDFLRTFEDWEGVALWAAAAARPSRHKLRALTEAVRAHLCSSQNLLERRASVVDATRILGSEAHDLFSGAGLADVLKGDSWQDSTSAFVAAHLFSQNSEGWSAASTIMEHLWPQGAPRIPVSVQILKDIAAHFMGDGKEVPRAPRNLQTLSLYDGMCVIDRVALLHFLHAVEAGAEDETFYTMPSEYISSFYGRGRSPMAQEEEHAATTREPRRPLKPLPSLILADEKTLHYLYRGVLHSSLPCLPSSLLAVIPSSNILEQHVVEVDRRGSGRLIAVTADGMEVVLTFHLDGCDDDDAEDLHWIDVRRKGTQLYLEWGGNFELRGTEAWLCFTGLNEAVLDGEDGNFFIEAADAGPRDFSSTDWTRHGNRLSIMRRHRDRDDGETRTWERIQVVAEGAGILESTPDLRECSCVWGAARQYVAVHESGLASLVTHGAGERKTTFAVPPRARTIALLPSLSR